MTNHPEDCQHKQCPWHEPDQPECKTCFSLLKEDEAEFCKEHLEEEDQMNHTKPEHIFYKPTKRNGDK